VSTDRPCFTPRDELMSCHAGICHVLLLCSFFLFPWGGPRVTDLVVVGRILRQEGKEREEKGKWFDGLFDCLPFRRSPLDIKSRCGD